MLERLVVENLAVVERAEAEFRPGLNVLTGETGAGKSVLMGALDLVLGGRADSSLVRDGASEARVEAVFAPSGAARENVARILEEAGIDFGEERLAVRRTVGAQGGGRTWVNDTPSSVGLVKRLGRILVDIHGARANQRILEEGFQREALDSFGGILSLPSRKAYDAAWRRLNEVRREMAELEGGGEVEDEIDMLRFQTNELEAAALCEEDETIGERQLAAARTKDAIEAANAATELLGGDNGAAAILERLRPQFRLLEKSFAGEDWSERAESLRRDLESLSGEINRAVLRLEGAEEDLDSLDERLALVNRLKRKYRAADVAALMALSRSKRDRLERLESRGARLEQLGREESALLADLARAGGEVRAARQIAAAKIAKAVTKELRELGFARAKFAVEVRPARESAHGLDEIVYLFEPNPGESARVLADIASSGEAARVMLALKTVLSAHDETDVLVFDEIDANIGGETGAVVGAKMRKTAEGRQAIAITHLPQSAVFGRCHLVVEKRVEGGRTRTAIRPVEGEERIKEISRMLGGEKLTSVIMKHAEELLEYGNND